jgi:hypothetical protein
MGSPSRIRRYLDVMIMAAEVRIAKALAASGKQLGSAVLPTA